MKRDELRAKWIAALRSGDYRQGMTALRRAGGGEDEDSYCCLGVLCDVYDPGRWSRRAGDTWYCYRGLNGSLPEEVRKLVGLTDGEAQALVDLNDGLYPEGMHRRLTFPEIANHLETKWTP